MSMIDWSLPLEQLPDDVPFAELPPVAQALVRRNILLREKLAAAEAALVAAEKKLQALEAQKAAM
jgi:hypothetical protein